MSNESLSNISLIKNTASDEQQRQQQQQNP